MEQRRAEDIISTLNSQISDNPTFCRLMRVMVQTPFTVLRKGDKKYEQIQTGATDGKMVYYNIDFFKKLSISEQRFLICHETMHNALMHMVFYIDYFKKSPILTNVAMDMVVNNILVRWNDLHLKYCEMNGLPQEDFITLIEGGCYDKKYNNWSFAQVFNDLYKENKDKQDEQGDGQDGGQGDGQGNGEPLDNHLWEEAKEIFENPEEAEKMAEEMRQALRSGESLAGVRSGLKDGDLEKLFEVKTDWIEVLRNFIVSSCSGYGEVTRQRPNRRSLGNEILMPSIQSKSVGDVVIGYDASGSVLYDTELATRFASEIKKICEQVKPKSLRVLYWDTNVEKVEFYKHNKLSRFEVEGRPRGGGGTSPDCVPKYLEKNNIRPQVVIMLTDGYVNGWGDWSKIKAPLLWCIKGSNDIPTIGKTVAI